MIGVGEAQSVRGLEEVGVWELVDVAWRSDRGERGWRGGIGLGNFSDIGNGRKRGLRLGVEFGCWGVVVV